MVIELKCEQTFNFVCPVLSTGWYRSATGSRYGGDQALLHADAARLLTAQEAGEPAGSDHRHIQHRQGAAPVRQVRLSRRRR